MVASVDKEMEVLPAFLEKFPAWKSFPAGLRILLLDEDEVTLRHSRAQLEACSYTVAPFSDRRSAMDALQQQTEIFHLAIVEVNLKNSAEAFNVVRAAKHLPTILLSAAKNVTLMMEGIAAGALEFLEKPLSEDKAKNLWQHVFRKALATGELSVPKKERDDCIVAAKDSGNNGLKEDLHIKEEEIDPCTVVDDGLQYVGDGCDQLFFDNCMYEGNHDEDGKDFESVPDERPGTINFLVDGFVVKSPGPSTPQLEQAETRALHVSDDESPHSQDFTGMNACMEEVNSSDDCSSFMCVRCEADDMDCVFQSSLEGEDLQSLEDFNCLDASLSDCRNLNDTLEFQDGLSLADDLVDELSSCIDMDSSILDELPSEDSLQLSLECMDDDDQRDEEALLLAEVAKAEAGMARSSSNYMSVTPMSGQSDKPSSDQSGKGGGKSLAHSKKKMKVDWTPELHRRFVQAVEHLGVDKAIPSRILEIMGVQHLTRHNIASHLQKYRSHKKHMQAREAEAATWNQNRQMEATRQPPQPHVVSRPAPLVPMGLHVWGHPTPDQYWPKPWPASEGSLWHHSPSVCMDAWGHPAPGAAPFFHPSQCATPFVRIPLAPIPGAINRAVPILLPAEKLMPGLHPLKDKVDAAINEVMKNPHTPLPLGLKPPSLESVLNELQRQGMKTVPPSPP